MESCNSGDRCPFIGNRSIHTLLRELQISRGREKELEGVAELAYQRITELEREKKELTNERDGLKSRLKKFLTKIFKPRAEVKVSGVKKGAPAGHKGVSRVKPLEVTEYKDIYPKRCKDCGNEDIKVYEEDYTTHTVEDIKIIKVVTCHRKHYGYCPRCKKTIYPSNEDSGEIPHDRIGSTCKAIAGYFRYLGLPYRKVEKVFKDVFDINIAHPTFLAFSNEQAGAGDKIYSELKEGLKDSSSAYVDETGWRVVGENWWLWAFVTDDITVYEINKSRGGEVVRGILGEKYNGTLVSDFYPAYNTISANGKQRCCAHLLREVKEIGHKNNFEEGSVEGRFCKELKEVFKDAINAHREVKEGVREEKGLLEVKEEVADKLIGLVKEDIKNDDIKRIQERLIRHHDELLVFLDNPAIEPTNNRAERSFRWLVIIRKIIMCHRTEKGAHNHGVISSIVETGRQKGVSPLEIFKALTKEEVTKWSDIIRNRGP